MKRNVLFAAVIAGSIVAGLMVLSQSAALAGDPIKERQELMKGVGKAMKQLGAIFKGTVEFDGAVVKAAGATIAANVGQVVNKFPDGSTSPDSEAKATIWEDPAGFRAAAKRAIAAAGVVSKVGADGNMDAYQQAFLNLGGGCKNCHTKYREKKKQ